MRETYEVMVQCENCGFIQKMDIPKETRVDDSTCPHCECRGTLSRQIVNKVEEI